MYNSWSFYHYIDWISGVVVMEFVKIFLLVVIFLVSCVFSRPQGDGNTEDNGDGRSTSVGVSVDADNEGNVQLEGILEHDLTDDTSVYIKHQSNLGNHEHHETTAGINQRIGDNANLNFYAGGNSDGNVKAGVGLKVEWDKKKR